MTFEEAVRRFLEEKRRAVAATTLKAYTSVLRIVGRDLNSRRLASITGTELTEVILGAPISRSTQAQRYRVLRIFLNWCFRKGLASRHPMPRRCPVLQVETRPRAVKADDLRKITDALRGDYRKKRSQYRCAEEGLVGAGTHLSRFHITNHPIAVSMMNVRTRSHPRTIIRISTAA